MVSTALPAAPVDHHRHRHRTGTVTSRANQSGRHIRSVASAADGALARTAMHPASPPCPGQRSPARPPHPAAGGGSANQTTRTSRRTSWTSQMTHSGVRCTGDRHTAGGERVGVVHLGDLLARECRAYDDTSSCCSCRPGERPGTAGRCKLPAAPPVHQAARCPPEARPLMSAARGLRTGRDPGRLERVGQPPGLVHVRGHRQPGELHRDERHPRSGRGQHRLLRCGDLHPQPSCPARPGRRRSPRPPTAAARCRLSFDCTNRPPLDASKSRTGSNGPGRERPVREHLGELDRDRTLQCHDASRAELLGCLVIQADSQVNPIELG